MAVTQPLLSIEHLKFSYAGTRVLEDVSLKISAGEFVALVGPNGSGKSTLVKLALGLLSPEAGTIETGAPQAIGYVPQRHVVGHEIPATVSEVVEAGVLSGSTWWRKNTRKQRKVVADAIAAVGMTEMRDQRISRLSGGQQQRVMIAKALAAQPSLLVLDEPVAGVDAQSQRQFRDTLHSLVLKGTAVLLVSHELAAVADVLDRVVVLRQGVVDFDGTPSDLTSKGISLGVHATDLPVWLEGQ